MMMTHKFIYQTIASLVLLCSMQSCFQDLDQDPAFDYPQGVPDPTVTYNVEKLHLPFDGDLIDQSTYQFIATSTDEEENIFGAGITNQAYVNNKDHAYMLVKSHPAIDRLMKDTLSNMGSFTVSFWMNTARNTAATGIFTLSNTTQFWGNLDVLLENTGSETEAFFKVHILNQRESDVTEHWMEVRMPDAFNKWTHVTFKYNASNSTLTALQNGDEILSQELKDGSGTPIGKLRFSNLGVMVIGTTQFQTTPSLTTNTGNQDWAGWFKGSLDQLHLYSKALSNSDIKALYTNKN